ncbi:MAG: hypothetical protein KEFWMYNX_002095 [Candidatus Fervidibacter sp.]
MEWQKKFGKQGLVIIAFSHMPAQMQRDLAKSMGINYTLAVWDKDKFPKPISLVMGYPTNLLIDRQGRFRAVVMGPMLDRLEKELTAALKEKPPADKAPPVKPTKAPR